MSGTRYVDAPPTFFVADRLISLALDRNGTPHIACGGDHLYYATWNGTGWDIEIVDGTFWVGKYPSLALDSQGHPHIAYYNGDLKYAYFDGNSWHIETVDVGAYASLALDSAGHPHIAYYNGDLKYAYFDGSSWHIETVDSDWGVGKYASLALDSQDHPHIAYYDDTNDGLKYAYYDGSSWHIETVDSDGYLVGWFASLALDSQDHPHIAYYGSGLNYAHYDGTSWHIEIVDSGGAGQHASLALDSADHPHIAYRSGMEHLKYAHWSGTCWQFQIVDSNGNVGRYASISLDSQDHPHIAYYDSTDEDLKYAYAFSGANEPPVIDSFTANPTSGTAPLTVTFTCTAHDPDGSIASYTFTPGDGSAPISSNDGSFIHTYNNPGTYNAACAATDNHGESTCSSPVTIQVSGGTTYALTISPAPAHGTVTSNPAGINCGSGGDDCNEDYAEGTDVTLTATADNGYTFSGWGGDCSGCGNNTTCTITMNADMTCSAEFEEVPNQPPVIDSFTANPTSGDAPLEVTFTCIAHDPDGSIASYELNPGDGSDPISSNDGSFTYTYNNPGTYNATCTAYDNDGASTSSEPVTVEVSSEAVTASDLVVTKLLTPRYWRAGKRGHVTVMIENQGEEDITEPFVVRVHANPMVVYIIGEQTVNGLAAGERKLLRFRFTVPDDLCYPNTHTLYVTVDADDQISETNEENNTLTKTIIIRGCK